MSTRPLDASRTAWLPPWWPTGSRCVSAPAASASSWWPRQMPRIGGPPSIARLASVRTAAICGVHARRVAGPRRQDDQVRGRGEDVRGAAVGRQHGDLEPAGRERRQQRALHPVVDQGRAGRPRTHPARRCSARGSPTPATWSIDAHCATRPASATASLIGQRVGPDDGSPQDAAPQLERQGARVDPGQGRDAGLDQQVLERDARPIRRRDQAGADQRAGVHPARLELARPRSGSCPPSGASGPRSGRRTTDRSGSRPSRWRPW